MVMVDRRGRHVEVILLNRGHGTRPWIRVSWRGYLLGPGHPGGPGPGYYLHVRDALAQVDADSLVELVTFPAQPADQTG